MMDWNFSCATILDRQIVNGSGADIITQRRILRA
jgi:hypothetical protein